MRNDLRAAARTATRPTLERTRASSSYRQLAASEAQSIQDEQMGDADSGKVQRSCFPVGRNSEITTTDRTA